jgi:hypothetical protein
MNAQVDIETQARAKGWRSKEEFRGKPEDFVDAVTYVAREKEIMPILRKTNAQLEAKLSAAEHKLAEQAALIADSQTAIQELKNFNTKMGLDKVKGQKAEIIANLVEAKKAGDTDREVALADQLSETNAAIREAEKAPVVKAAPTTTTTAAPTQAAAAAKAEFDAWVAENSWYNDDPVKHGLADGIAVKLKKSNSPLTGRAFYDEVASQVEKFSGGPPARQAADRVESGSRPTGGSGSANGKSYADLPPEAKAACEKFAKNDISIGKGKTFETIEAWRSYYAQTFFNREQGQWKE